MYMIESLPKPSTIFIADDDEDDVYFVREALKELDQNIVLKHFCNGKALLQALAKTIKQLPCLVILDLNMPILDGRETLRQIRSSNSLSELPVVVLSTSNHAHEKEVCFNYGANCYFTKPYSYSMYLDIVRNVKREWIDKIAV